jgi:hemerythrin-like domain-containing protein
MTPIENLHMHHEKLIQNIQQLAERTKHEPPDASLLLTYCCEFLIPHAEGEESTLYAACNDTNFIKQMLGEHEQIKQKLDEIKSSLYRADLNTVVTSTDEFTKLLYKHFEEEENALMPLLSSRVPQQHLESLIQQAHHLEKSKKPSDLRALFEYDHKRIDINISIMQNVRDKEMVLRLYTKVKRQLLKHIELEETVLFPVFTEHAMPNQTGPIQVMVSEHREITSHISIPTDETDTAALLSNLERLISLLAVHNKKEELILYPLINRTVPSGEKARVYKECLEKFREV